MTGSPSSTGNKCEEEEESQKIATGSALNSQTHETEEVSVFVGRECRVFFDVEIYISLCRPSWILFCFVYTVLGKLACEHGIDCITTSWMSSDKSRF